MSCTGMTSCFVVVAVKGFDINDPKTHHHIDWIEYNRSVDYELEMLTLLQGMLRRGLIRPFAQGEITVDGQPSKSSENEKCNYCKKAIPKLHMQVHRKLEHMHCLEEKCKLPNLLTGEMECQQFKSCMLWENHMFVHHKIHYLEYSCKVCKAVFNTQYGLHGHKVQHKQRVSCTLCKKTYKKQAVSMLTCYLTAQ
jgi:C2H2-type zinc finger